jgi:hypothetical protein
MHKKDRRLKVFRTVGLLLAPWVLANAQITPSVLPQLAFGGGWYTALYFTNENDTAVSFAVSFFTDTAIPLYLPSADRTCIPPVSGSGSCPVQLVQVPPHGTAIIEAPNVGDLSEGYASFSLPGNVVGYGVFRHSVSGYPDQEAVVPFSNVQATTNTLIFDETNFVTGVAMVNPTSIDTVVTITALDDQGNALGTSPVLLPANQKVAVAALESLQGLKAIIGHRGSAQFKASSGGYVSVLGLRFGGGSSAFTSIPVTSDAPLAVPPFSSMHISSQFQPMNFGIYPLVFTITPTNGNSTYTVAFPQQGLTLVNGTVTNRTTESFTLTFNTLPNITQRTWLNVPIQDVLLAVFTASLNLNVYPGGADPATGWALGSVSGLLSVSGTDLTGGRQSLSGPVFGTFVEPGPGLQQ